MNHISCLFPETVGYIPFPAKSVPVLTVVESEVKVWWKGLSPIAKEFYRGDGDMFVAKVAFYRHFDIRRIRRLLLEAVLTEDSKASFRYYNEYLPRLLRETWEGIIKENPVLTDESISANVRQKILIRIWNNHPAIQEIAKELYNSVKGIASDLVAKEIKKMIES